MNAADTRLAELGITLPTPAAPIANYVPYVITGNLLIISGQLCFGLDGKLASGHALVRQALELIQQMRGRTWPQPMVVEQIHLFNRFTIIAQMDNDAIFTFHPDELDKQLSRLHAILTKVGPSSSRVATVNLQLERNIPVTFFEPPTPAASKPGSKPASAAPSRRPAARRAP